MESTINLDLDKLTVYDNITRKWVPFYDRTNKTLTLQQAMGNLKKRRARYFEYRYDHVALIVERFFGMKNLGFHTYHETIELLNKEGFYNDDSNYFNGKIVDLADFKTGNSDVKYNVKIDFSYFKETDFSPCIRDYDVYYEGDEEETWSYSLNTKIYFDDLLVGEYDSDLEMEYRYKYFVYNINKAFT